MDHQDHPLHRAAFWCVVLAALVCFGPALAPSSWGQPLPSPSAHTGDAIPHFVHQLWTADDGLPVNSINDLLQTRDGYLWLATYDGLVRFDGVRFTVFNTQNTEGLTTNRMAKLLEDREGTLWVGTETEGLVRFSEGTVKTYPVGATTGATQVDALAEDRKGNLWIGVEAGVLRLSPDETFTAYTMDDGLVGSPVRTILESRDGSLWLGTYSGLSRLKDGAFTNYTTEDGLTDGNVTALHEDDAGTLWIGTVDGGLNRLKDGAFTYYDTDDGLAHITVRFLHEDPEGRLWVGTKGGLNLLQRDTTSGDISFVSYTTEDGLSENDVSNIWQDREGSFWIGTQTGGLNRFTATPFEILSREQGLSNTTFLALFEARDGSMWIGAGCEGLNHLKDGRVRVYTMADGLSSNCIWSIYEDEEGSIWAGTYTWGLNRLKDGTFTVYGKKDGLPDGAILAIYQDRQENLWFGTSKGLARWDDGTFTTYTEDDGLAHNWVRAIYEDRAGNLWLGTNGGGLSRFDGRTFTNFTTAEGLSNDRVRSIYEDAEGTFWIGTEGGGLNRFKDGAFTAFMMEDGLLDNTIHQILEDRRGNLWMSSNRGLFHVSRSDLNTYADSGRKAALEVISYGKKDGLRNPELNGGFQYAGIETRDGRFWFPSVAGVVGIHPEDIQRNTLPPPVVIERVLVSNKPLAHRLPLTLAPDERSFEIEYTGLSLLVPEKVRFKYQLVGYDEDWVDAGTRRTAFYTKVPPGDYTFRVIAANNDGVWNETGASFSFTLAPFFYETPWFLALCVLALALMGYGAYRWRTRQLEVGKRVLEQRVQERTVALQAVNEELQSFAHTVAHDLKGPIFTIEGFLGLLQKDAASGDEKRVADDIMYIRRAARKMQGIIDALLLLAQIRKREVDWASLDMAFIVAEAQRRLALLIEQRQAVVTVAETWPTAWGYAPWVEEVWVNYLSNALKYGGESPQIELGATPEATGMVRFWIRDNGKGLTQEEQAQLFVPFRRLGKKGTEGHGLGLSIVQRIVEKLGGEVGVDSEGLPGRGSTFRFTLPMDGPPSPNEGYLA